MVRIRTDFNVQSISIPLQSYVFCHGSIMRYFFHILTDTERLRDPDGGEFPTLAEAFAEATQSARDLIAEELRCGRAVPSLWSIQITQEDDTVLQAVPFVRLLIHDDVHQLHFRQSHDPRVIAHTTTRLRARAMTGEIIRHLAKLRENLGVLVQLNEELKKHCGR